VAGTGFSVGGGFGVAGAGCCTFSVAAGLKQVLAVACRESVNLNGQVLFDRIASMIELLQSTQAFLVRAGHARP